MGVPLLFDLQPQTYRAIIDKVINSVRPDFEENGIEEAVLVALQQVRFSLILLCFSSKALGKLIKTPLTSLFHLDSVNHPATTCTSTGIQLL